MSTSWSSYENGGPLPPQLSRPAFDALEVYRIESRGHASSDTLARSIRNLGTLAAFAPDNFPQRAFDAAAMLPLARHLDEPNQNYRYRAAGRGLHDYFTHSAFDELDPAKRRKSNAYVGTLLGDIPYLDKAADSYMERLHEAGADAVFTQHDSIPKRAFIDLRVGPSIPVLAETATLTNAEMQLGLAANMADHIFHPQDDDHKLLRDILRIETFYSPLVEIYGLHANDMMMQSNVGKKRVLKSGNEKILEESKMILEEAKKISVEEILKQIFGRELKEDLFQSSQESLYDEQIIFSSISLGEICDHPESKINARFKTLGKYALKRIRNPSYAAEKAKLPADLFGMLAVLPDRKELGNLFGYIAQRVIQNDRIEPVVSASKSKPFYIKGSPEYVREVYMQLPPEIAQNVQLEVIKNTPEDHIYQVAKFTCEIDFAGQKLPVEFQFQTAFDRANARLGATAHMNHNAGHKDPLAAPILGSPSDARKIFMRMPKIDVLAEVVNGQSIAHGEEFEQKYRKSRLD